MLFSRACLRGVIADCRQQLLTAQLVTCSCFSCTGIGTSGVCHCLFFVVNSAGVHTTCSWHPLAASFSLASFPLTALHTRACVAVMFAGFVNRVVFVSIPLHADGCGAGDADG